MYLKLEECQNKLSILEQQLDSYQRTVYSAAGNLPEGTVITEDNVLWEIRYSDVPQEEFITQESFGMAVNFDVKEGTCLTREMLSGSYGACREVFVSEVDIPSFIQTGDRVDIRIRYGNAEDYTVLADKILVSCTPSEGMVMELSEEEILFLSSAVADKINYADTTLYAVKYPEYVQQETGNVTYIANREILKLLDREKTQGESRAALEERLLQTE